MDPFPGRRQPSLQRRLAPRGGGGLLRPTGSLGEVWVGGWQAADLIKPSAVKPMLATLEQRLLIRKLGTLGAGDQAAVRQAIAEILQ